MPSWYPASRGDMRSLFLGSQHCIFNGDDTIEVYDFIADPWEMKDIADSPQGRDVIHDARQFIEG